MQKIRRKFSKEFKENAVRLWLTSGKSSDVVAKELDIDGSRLRHWASELNTHGPNSFPGVGKRREKSGLEAENWRLKKELEQLREERDILKKAWAFFSSHLNNPTR